LTPPQNPSTVDRLRGVVEDAAGALAPEGNGLRSRPTLERAKKAEFGDFSTNAAMLLAPVVKASPRDVAARLGEELTERLGSGLDRTEVAGPGFLNIFLADEWYAGALRDILAAGDAFGGGTAATAEKVNIEFVSANPTGPVHVGHARNAAYGDALARILTFHGHDVFREFYVNDAGNQIAKFGESIRARARGEDVPEGGYRGDYVTELAAAIPGAADLDARALGALGVEEMLRRADASLSAFRVSFDLWFRETALHEGSPSEVEQAFATLDEQGRLYERDGALWVRTSDLGDDKDRVVRRSNGEHTYFASDIAYHWDKRRRGFDRSIDVWGADHHGYVQRMKAAYAALGGDPQTLELLIMQFVDLVSSGERARMSKRAGDFVTLDDLAAEIGVDAARWFLLNRSHDTKIELDLDLAVQESKQNPVYYVQYAHARLASLLRKAGEDAVPAELPPVALAPAERSLLQRLLAFPAEVAEASDRRAPHRIATYALDLAREFTTFYDNHPILKDDVPADVRAFRLALAAVTQRTIARSLDLLGVHAPESM
jgi:arginyl-tRNA synthetase